MKKIEIVFATRSDFKRQEMGVMLDTAEFTDFDNVTRKVGERFDIRFSDIPTDEPLEIDLVAMVRHKTISAYRSLLVPCMVEHAGIILDSCKVSGFPGGLTQPMWDALGPDGFLQRTGAAGQPAVAKAVIGFCDGMNVFTFTGETVGEVTNHPKGPRDFYWDTVFSPKEFPGLTYAEVSGDPGKGIPEKMKVSQSFRAFRKLLEMRANRGQSELFS